MLVTDSFQLPQNMSDIGHTVNKPISMFLYIELLLVTNRLPIVFCLWDDLFLRWSITYNTECTQISEISTPPKMIKIPLIVPLVVSGAAGMYNVKYVLEAVCSITTGKDVLLPKEKYLYVKLMLVYSFLYNSAWFFSWNCDHLQ